MSVYQLSVPVVWETASIARFGVDEALLRIHVASSAEAHIVRLLRLGPTAQQLARRAAKLEMMPADLDALLASLSSVCAPAPPLTNAPTGTHEASVVAHDHSATGTHLEALLRSLVWPHPITRVHITVDRFGYDSERISLLAMRGHTVLPIMMTDQSATIGPLISDAAPGPCAGCLTADLKASAPHWLKWASQLSGMALPSETLTRSRVIAALIETEFASQHPRGLDRTVLRLTWQHSGALVGVDRREFAVSPECANHFARASSAVSA